MTENWNIQIKEVRDEDDNRTVVISGNCCIDALGKILEHFEDSFRTAHIENNSIVLKD